MEDYRSNSHKSKAERMASDEDKKVEKVISGNAKVKKTSELQKFANRFISDDIDNVKSYVVNDILIPKTKAIISEMFTSAMDMLLFGESRHSGSSRNGSRTSYERYYKEADHRRDNSNSRSRDRYNFDNITLETRADADEVLSSMDDLLDKYNVVSVSDFYYLVGVDGDFIDQKWGWKSLQSAQIMRTRHGEFIIKLPRPIPID